MGSALLCDQCGFNIKSGHKENYRMQRVSDNRSYYQFHFCSITCLHFWSKERLEEKESE